MPLMERFVDEMGVMDLVHQFCKRPLELMSLFKLTCTSQAAFVRIREIL